MRFEKIFELNNLNNEIKNYLKDYLELKEGEADKIKIIKALDLPKNYQIQKEFLSDKRLDNINIVIVPDELWAKGRASSESDAEKNLILFKKSDFESLADSSESAWMTHELAHCQKFLNSKEAENYEKDMQTPAFMDIKTEYNYPNNLVEQYTFSKQFEFLKSQGATRESVLEMLNETYEKEDEEFFIRILDSVYKK
ncbi:MAG: hypothetical protein ACOYL8_02965 [Patescibacteria group bacterium]